MGKCVYVCVCVVFLKESMCASEHSKGPRKRVTKN